MMLARREIMMAWNEMIRALGRLAALALLAVATACSSPPPQAAPTPAQLGAYRLGSGDALRMIIYGEDKLSGEFRVSDSGMIALPLIGDLKAAGQTVDELTQMVTAAYSANVLRNPRIAIEIMSYRPFFILGSVGKPGQYQFIPGMTVRQAIATANGYTPIAKQKVVMITHWGEAEEKSYRLDAATLVRPGDTIRIPERVF